MRLSRGLLRSIDAIIDRASREGRSSLFEYEVYEVLSLAGLNPPTHQFISDPSDVTPTVLSRFSTDRIVLKTVSTQLSHKQKHGGVRTVLKDLEFVRYSCARMLEELADLNLSGILLVEYVNYDKDLGNEILLGFRESTAFGPVISFSKGGSDAEHFAAHFSEPNIILAPVDANWAPALLSSTQIHYKYISEGKDGYIDKISETVVIMSEIACAVSSFYPSDSHYNAFSRVLELGGIPTFLSAERAMMFLNAFIRYHLMKQHRDLTERLK